MRIGIDIDNVTTETIKSSYNVINNCKYKDELLKRVNKITNAIVDDIYIEHFYKNHAIEVFENAPIMPGAIDILTKLKNEGHTLIFITSRGDKNIYYKGVEKVTLDSFKTNNIPYDKIIFNITRKDDVCIKENIDILIDDNIKFCTQVSNVGIPVLVYNSEENKNMDVKNLPRVNNWKEVYDYIKKMS